MKLLYVGKTVKLNIILLLVPRVRTNYLLTDKSDLNETFIRGHVLLKFVNFQSFKTLHKYYYSLD